MGQAAVYRGLRLIEKTGYMDGYAQALRDVVTELRHHTGALQPALRCLIGQLDLQGLDLGRPCEGCIHCHEEGRVRRQAPLHRIK